MNASPLARLAILCLLIQPASFIRPALATTPAEWIEAELPSLVSLYKELPAAPELSLHETQTARRVADAWQVVGYTVTRGVGGTGVVGLLENGAGPTLMLRTDLDALPVVEETGREYASRVRTKDKHGAIVGVMHARGHDVHMTNLVGVARCLAENRDRWSGRLMLVAQPAEELGEGAKAMPAVSPLGEVRPDPAESFPTGVTALCSVALDLLKP